MSFRNWASFIPSNHFEGIHVGKLKRELAKTELEHLVSQEKQNGGQEVPHFHYHIP